MAGFLNLWTAYKNFVDEAIEGKENAKIKDISYWRARLFKNFILYVLPVSLIALTPAVYFGLKAGHAFIIGFDVLIFFLLAFVSLNKSISLNFRKSFVASLFYILSVVLIAVLGSFGPGVLYLMSSSVLYTLIFSIRIGYLSVLFHLITSVFFAFVIKFRLFETPLAEQYDLGSWIAFSSNVVFLSLLSVVMISKFLTGLENTIVKELRLHAALEKESAERADLNMKLRESKGHYKSIFIQNPSPMWVIDAESLRFLQVNDAAVEAYKYSKEDFLTMGIQDLRLASDLDRINAEFKTLYNSGKKHHYYTRHVTKDKQIFDVEVRCNTIMLHGKQAVLAIGRDITDTRNYIEAIEAQNKKLQDIAYIQSHVVRAPLASIMGLVNLIKMDLDKNPDPELVERLAKAAAEFDDTIKEIINNTEQMAVLQRPG